MLRWTKLIAPAASLALLIGFHQAQLRADDAAATGTATVTVTVVDSTGKPVSGVKVGIYAAAPKKHKTAAADGGATTQPTDGTKPKVTALVTGETAADGTVALAKVPNGDYSVRANLKGAGRGTAKVTIADDKDQAVSVTLAAPKSKN